MVIAGGGIAGLEALLALNDLGADRLDLTLVAPDPEFVYRPLVIDEAFSLSPAERRELEPLAGELGARFVRQPLAAVRPADQVVALGDGSELEYDALVVCVGGRPRPVYTEAVTFWDTSERLAIRDLLEQAAASASKRLAFVVPPGVTWSLPLYELALMFEREARIAEGGEVELLVVTPESAPLTLFGEQASQAVAELLQARGIEVRASSYVSEAAEGLVIAPGHERLEAGAAIALPVIDGPAIAGLPADADGFMPIDEHARVKGADGVYAAGDGTNFPIKQGGIGTQEADAAAEHIAARFAGHSNPAPFRPVLRGKLITGEETLSMLADVAGGAGEGAASADYLWWPPHKVSGRYLAPYLVGATPYEDPEPPGHSLDVEVALPMEWHREPMRVDAYGAPAEPARPKTG